MILCILLAHLARYPSGHYVRTLGNVGDKEAETEAILLQHDVTYTHFSENAMACLPSADWIADKVLLSLVCVYVILGPRCQVSTSTRFERRMYI